MSDIVTSSRTETITVSAGLCSARRLAVPRQTFAPRTVSPTHSSRLLRALRLSKSTNVNMDFPGAPSVKTLAREETAHYIWRRRFDVRQRYERRRPQGCRPTIACAVSTLFPTSGCASVPARREARLFLHNDIEGTLCPLQRCKQ